MRYIFILSLFIFSIQVKAQGPQIKLSIEFSVDDISGERFVPRQTNGFSYGILREQSNYTFGVSTTISSDSKFSLQTGIMYSNKDFETFEVCPACLTLIDLSPTLIEQRFLTVPFLLNYRFSESRFRPNLEVGIINNLGLADRSDLTKRNFMEGQIGFGLAYSISERIDVSVAYRLRTAFSAIYNQREIDTRPSDNDDPNSLNTKSFSIGLNYSIN